MSFSCSSHILVITSRGLIPAKHAQPLSAHAVDTVCKKSTQERYSAEDCLCISRDQGKPVAAVNVASECGHCTLDA